MESKNSWGGTRDRVRAEVWKRDHYRTRTVEIRLIFYIVHEIITRDYPLCAGDSVLRQ